MKFIFLVQVLLFTALPVHAQPVEENPSCFRVLYCTDNQEFALDCLRDRSSSAARACKYSQSPNADGNGEIFSQFPLVLLLLFIIWGMMTLEPLTGWIRGMIVGTALSIGMLVLEQSSLVFLHPYLPHIAFPSVGIMSFSPSFLTYLPFSIEFLLANIILYTGIFGLVGWKHKYANLAAAGFALIAVLLSIYDVSLL